MTSSAKTLRAPDMVRVYAAALAMAWCKYQDTFGETPHGTLDQMSALVELAGGEKVLTRVAALKRKRTGKKRRNDGNHP